MDLLKAANQGLLEEMRKQTILELKKPGFTVKELREIGEAAIAIADLIERRVARGEI